MKLKQYFIVGPSMRAAVYCYNYMRNLLRDKITWTSSNWRIINIDEYRLVFMSEEQYFSKYRDGSRTEVINCYYVERLLDMYKTLARI